MAKFFEGTEGSNIDTNSSDARRIIESTNFDSIDNKVSLDVKKLDTSVSHSKEQLIQRLENYTSGKNHRQWEERP